LLFGNAIIRRVKGLVYAPNGKKPGGSRHVMQSNRELHPPQFEFRTPAA